MTLPTDPASSSSTTLYITVFLFAAISCLVYKFVLSPPPAETTQTRINAAPTSVTQRNTSSASVPSRSNQSTNTNNSTEDDYFNYGTNRHPPHFTPPEKWNSATTSLSKYLLNGIVPFRSTRANGYETRLAKQSPEEDLITLNRKDRARIFARLFSLAEEGGKKPPPNRGANIVVTIYPCDGSCVKLQKALMLLGTYYNLFVLVDGSGIGGSMKEQSEVVKKFREEMLNMNENASEAISHRLNEQILPPHRIVFSSTTAGRVAFVRQLNGVELIVDGEQKVTRELERFGHRVLLYPKGSKGDGSSALGKFLIP